MEFNTKALTPLFNLITETGEAFFFQVKLEWLLYLWFYVSFKIELFNSQARLLRVVHEGRAKFQPSHGIFAISPNTAWGSEISCCMDGVDVIRFDAITVFQLLFKLSRIVLGWFADANTEHTLSSNASPNWIKAIVFKLTKTVSGILPYLTLLPVDEGFQENVCHCNYK